MSRAPTCDAARAACPRWAVRLRIPIKCPETFCDYPDAAYSRPAVRDDPCTQPRARRAANRTLFGIRVSGFRSPVRAAPLRLEAEAFVRHDDRKWKVTPPNLGKFAAVAKFRGTLETAAVQPTCARTRSIPSPLPPCSTCVAAPSRAGPVTRPARISAQSCREFPAIRSW